MNLGLVHCSFPFETAQAAQSKEAQARLQRRALATAGSGQGQGNQQAFRDLSKCAEA